MLKTSKHFFLRQAAIAFATSSLLAGAAIAQADIDFEISDGKVVPSEAFAAKVSVLGAAITSSGQDVPVTVQVRVGDDAFEPFGASNDPDTGDVNDHSAPRHFIIEQMFNAHAKIEITGTSWINNNIYLSRNSHDQSPSVKVLRNGDAVPDIKGFQSQADAVEFIRNYIDNDTQTIMLDENQVIYLFELGTTNLSSSAADFQDLVVLVTLGKSPEELKNDELMETMYD